MYLVHLYLLLFSLQIYALELSLESLQKIWSQDSSSAFVTLAEYEGSLWLAFRGSDLHAGGKDGVIRILESKPPAPFQLKTTLIKPGIDLRDPKFSITPTNRLMVSMGGSRYRQGKLVTFFPEVAFYTPAQDFSEPVTIPLPGEWIWGLSWWDGRGYGFSYSFLDPNNPSGGFGLKLFSTKNGTEYTLVAPIALDGSPSEAALAFQEGGQAKAVVRRWGNSYIGTSSFPFENWSWRDSGERLEGPCLLFLPSGELLAGARTWRFNSRSGQKEPKTVLGTLGDKGFQLLVELPSGGDNGYPALLYYRGKLLMAYYSSHEGSATIYLATIIIKE